MPLLEWTTSLDGTRLILSACSWALPILCFAGGMAVQAIWPGGGESVRLLTFLHWLLQPWPQPLPLSGSAEALEARASGREARYPVSLLTLI